MTIEILTILSVSDMVNELFFKRQLNKSQYDAVTTTEGPLLVLAGAGSGKTRVITFRILYLLRIKNIKPSRILAVTFTNKAANEMKERVIELLQKRIKFLTVTTFHSLGVRILKKHIDKLGYKQNFNIYDESDRKNLVKGLLKDLKLDDFPLDLNKLLTTISLAKNSNNASKFINSIADTDYKLIINKIYKEYKDALKSYNSVDFDDLILLPMKILKKFPDVKKEYHERFQYIMVDEYQDTNNIQYRFLKQLISSKNNLCVVGDDDQAIYGFRGSKVEHILKFANDFPDAKTITLDKNYRSTKNILFAAEALIKNNNIRHTKIITTPNPDGKKILIYGADTAKEETEFIINKISTYRLENNLKWKDFALLYRTNFQSREYEEILRFKNIPYRIIGGMQFFDRKEIKDIIAYLKSIVNNKDEISLLRIINYPRRGIGPKSIGLINKYSSEHDISFFQALEDIDKIDGIKEGTKGNIIEFHNLLKKYQYEFNKTDKPLYKIVSDLVKEIKYEDTLMQENEEQSKIKWKMYNIRELIGSIKNFEDEEKESDEKASIYNYLNKISLMTKDEETDEKDDKISLMTFHLSKGLEFESVFLVGTEDDFIPHQKSLAEGGSLEEERRLFYVGMTRAKKFLHITYSKKRKKFGQTETKIPSRFIKEIPEIYTMLPKDEIVDEKAIASEALKKLKSIVKS